MYRVIIDAAAPLSFMELQLIVIATTSLFMVLFLAAEQKKL